MIAIIDHRTKMLVQLHNVLRGHAIVAQIVQDVDELFIALAEDLIELDMRVSAFLQRDRLEKMCAAIPFPQHTHLLILHHWRQLVQIADQQQLRTTEAQVPTLPHTTHAEVDRIEQIRA